MFVSIMLIVVGAMLLSWYYTRSSRALGPGSNLSRVSKQLLSEYNSLPAESRPFQDITSILEGLDMKYSTKAKSRDNHFNDNYFFYLDEPGIGGGYKFKWRASGAGPCNHGRHCPFADYYRLHNEIQAVKDSIEETKKAIEMAKYDPNDFGLLTARLRDEVKIQNEVRKELS